MMDDVRIGLHRLILKVRAEIPKKTSQLINDSGFVTSSGGGGGTSFTTDETLSLENGVTFLKVDNSGGVFTAKAGGAMPTTDMTIQATLMEVN